MEKSKITVTPKEFKRLFWDIETSPNIGIFWQPSYKASIGPENIIKERAIICICYKWENQKTIHSLTWDENQNDKQLLLDFIKIISQADEIVSHNGDSFDEKWFRTRCLYHQIPCPPKFPSLDTLKKAKKHFRFNSNKLDYIGRFLIGEGKIGTGFDLWKKILLEKCDKSLKDMVKYCKKDVKILEEIYKRLQPYIEHNHHIAIYTGGNKYDCPNCGGDCSLSKTRTTKLGGIKRQLQCKTCFSYHTVSDKDFIAKTKSDIYDKSTNDKTD
jgi:hypothetical protein